MDPHDPIGLTQALIRCPSLTPTEAGSFDILEGALRPLGFAIERLRFASAGQQPVDNLYAKLGSGGPHLAFSGHVDVVPPGDLALWTADPFSGDIRDGRIYGRGAADMKSGIAAFVAAAARFLDRHTALPGALSLLITADEEGPSIDGTAKLLEWAQMRGERFDAAIVGEPTCPTRLGETAKIGRRGSLVGWLTVRGRQGHTAYPDRADNAAHRLLECLRALREEPLDQGTEWFQPSSLAITSIDIGNPTPNVIPAEARATFNIRYNDLHTQGSLETWLRHRLDAIGGAYVLRTAASGDAFLTQPGELAEKLSVSVEEVTGQRPELNTTGGTSDARFIRRYCPVIEFGLVGASMHQSDEHVGIADLEGLTEIYVAFLERFFGAR
jgi:succinyl-diaminopimelate desuccinylase